MMRLLEREACGSRRPACRTVCGNPGRALTNELLEEGKPVVAVHLPVVFRHGGDERIGFLDGCVQIFNERVDVALD